MITTVIEIIGEVEEEAADVAPVNRLLVVEGDVVNRMMMTTILTVAGMATGIIGEDDHGPILLHHPLLRLPHPAPAAASVIVDVDHLVDVEEDLLLTTALLAEEAVEVAEAVEVIVGTILVVTAPEAAAGDEEGLVLLVHVLAPDRENERAAAAEAVAIVTILVAGEIVTIARMKRSSRVEVQNAENGKGARGMRVTVTKMTILCIPPVLRDEAKAVDMAIVIDHPLVEAKNENMAPRPMTIIGTETATMTVEIAAPKRRSVEVLPPRRKSAVPRVATTHHDDTTVTAIVEIDKSRTMTRRKILPSNPLVRLRVFRGVLETLRRTIYHHLDQINGFSRKHYKARADYQLEAEKTIFRTCRSVNHFINESHLLLHRYFMISINASYYTMIAIVCIFCRSTTFDELRISIMPFHQTACGDFLSLLDYYSAGSIDISPQYGRACLNRKHAFFHVPICFSDSCICNVTPKILWRDLDFRFCQVTVRLSPRKHAFCYWSSVVFPTYACRSTELFLKTLHALPMI